MNVISVLLCAAVIGSATAFFTISPAISSRAGLKMVATETRAIASIEAPDFYWKYRLDRLVNKKGGDLPFSESNYPGVDGYKDLYDTYYLDLTLQGKLEGFDWEEEKKITDGEWQAIYKAICKWSAKTAKDNKPDTTNLPSNDFDLLKQYYPQLNFRDLDTPFAVEEVGSSFPYKTMKEMLGAASEGSLKVPGYSSVTSLEATDAKKKLADLKERTMAQIEAIYSETMAYAENSFPDDAAKAHYKKLREKLADFPQDAAGWKNFRANMEKQVDEMARLASKKVDHHHHHHHDEGAMSPAEEFEAKYGKNLDEMQERMARFKSDPEAFLENSILEKYGKNGLDVWKKSQEFSEKMAVMSDADKKATESKFSDFLKQA